MLSESDLDPFFEQATTSWFRFEAHRAYTTSFEQPRLRAYLAGQPYDASSEPTQWLDYIQERVADGIAFFKVRVVAGPLTAYERWECEWSYPATERVGQRTFILDLAETSTPPGLSDDDWWMFDDAAILKMHYADDGTFVGAEHLDDPDVVADHVKFKVDMLAAAVAFKDYWTAHPQYWRKNWVNLPT